ncbi:hypothetical protein L207DRAFT_491161 [Hyaloscypha variabilis F]|uniref:CNNM transmembrane domain-containing protein n=1 Tax=Hyaloscypha variabilis (strain UAMH 11265 / GT02V1 / F) TaxID=1149755 RepID=A0A2J6RL26_HYAVF|nr:hypothetical protein L207DRAFT_491161 [Hyaloscypha variabilis F]
METRPYAIARFHHGAWVGMSILATVLLIISALLAGLTLGVCGLDSTLLQLRCITGTPRERRQARMVAGMKRRGTWMLCSLIISAVLCSETFPFVISTLYHGNQIWVPILFSTGLLAICAEILPQFFIPRQAISWGYYCWPLIWGCMFITAIISWPLAWLLDHLACKSQKDEYGVFSNHDLGTLVRHHERSEKNGGKLGQDASRIMLGALSLDSRKVGGEIHAFPRPSCDDHERDTEKADLVVVHGLIVQWHMVKTIDINEKVDSAFIKKVRMWSYSRIPVVGESEDEENKEAAELSSWNGRKIFGFLHIKNLIGIDINGKRNDDEPLLVKDLPLYPLPIVREDMSVYELLNMFQLGMARMAVVVPAAPKQPRLVLNDEWDGQSTRWTGTQRTNNHIKAKLKASNAKFDWTVDFLEAAQRSVDDSLLRRHRIYGIRCPKPVGIVTFEDIIDTILQKTSRDENDFFDRPTSTPPTKSKKAGDYTQKPVIGGIVPNSTISLKHSKGPTFFEKSAQPNKLRKRNPSQHENPANLDGADERSRDTNSSDSITAPKSRKDFVESSYTQNKDLAELANTSTSTCADNRFSPTKTSSLPSRTTRTTLGSSAEKKAMRHASAAPVLPTLRRITPFGRNTESYEKSEEAKQAVSELIIPAPSTDTAPAGGSLEPCLDNDQDVSIFDMDGSIDGDTDFGRDPDCELSSNLIMMDSSEEEHGEGILTLYNAFPVPPSEEETNELNLDVINEEGKKKSYDGFPAELLDGNDENKAASYNSKTMPRLKGSPSSLALKRDMPAREQSFHDDRAMLPSQRTHMQAEDIVIGTRSSSLWW